VQKPLIVCTKAETWAVSDNNEIGSGQIAAPCTFRHEGRIADFRYARKLNWAT
jgi:hypothetical protein